MGVMMQAFYWDCPRIEGEEFAWWEQITATIPSLAKTGFTSLWVPPPSKAASNRSMGYDPYDYYDVGEFDQKGGTETWFGSKKALVDMIGAAHAKKMEVYADFVINHNSGADAQENNPLDKQDRWTKFNPKSGKFSRDWKCFHPSSYERWDGMMFGQMPDLCHRNPYVFAQLIEHAQWLIEEIGFDGFRFDFVKGYGAWMVRAIQEIRYLKRGEGYKPFSVGECWDSDRVIEDWLSVASDWSDNPVSAFDFPLKYRLRDLCDVFGVGFRQVVAPGVLYQENAGAAVTFVDNHDTDGNSPTRNDKLLAYAFILTHEGYPCVFWKDYFVYGLADEGGAYGIAALVQAHEQLAGGDTSVLYLSDDLYVMQRNGFGNQRGLVLAMNNRGDAWNGNSVKTRWANTRFVPVAWWGATDRSRPQDQWSGPDGWVSLWAAPRGYVVYAPS